MSKKNNELSQSVSKEPWLIFAVGLGIVGLLVWMGWEVTQPDVIRRNRR